MPFLPKDIPPPITGRIIPPDLERPYFENCLALPFKPRSNSFEVNNAWWLAEASFLAYQNPNEPLNFSGLTDAEHRVAFVATPSAQAVVIEGPEVIIVAFRGTRFEGFGDPCGIFRLETVSVRDIVTDLHLSPVEVRPGCFVHEGVKQAFDEIWPKVRAEIQLRQQANPRMVWFAGHSLGAALATLAADCHPETQGLYLYGPLRVGNVGFVESFPVKNCIRLIHACDFAPFLPPGDFYQQVGQVKYVHPSGKIADTPAVRTLFEIARRVWFVGRRFLLAVLKRPSHLLNADHWPVPIDALADHAPIYYANHTWNFALRTRYGELVSNG